MDTVFGDPLISITAALCEDAGHHALLHQVNLDPLMLVVKLGEPRTPDDNQHDAVMMTTVVV